MDKNSIYIILCDDDSDDREFFSLVATSWAPGATVQTVETAAELLNKLKEDATVDLVFLDLNMPIVSGMECLEKIRRDHTYDGVVVIIYSTSTNEMEVEEAFRKGASLYVQKPFSTAGLKKILEDILAMDKASLLAAGPRKFLIKT